MYKTFLLMAIISFSGMLHGQSIDYPETRRGEQVDDYFGHEIADPYRWLEDENSDETRQWITNENEITFKYLEEIPFRNKLRDRLESLWNYEKMGIPQKYGPWIIYFKNSGMQNQSVLYCRKGYDGEEKLLLDPNTLSEDGTTSLATYSVSHDYKYFAYAISKGGSDWNEIFVINIETGEKLTDHIKWAKFSGISWCGKGFYYSSYDVENEEKALTTKNEYHKVYYHELGNPQSKDELIYENKKYPLRNYGAFCDRDENYLFIAESEGTSGNQLYFKSLKSKKSDFIQLAYGFEYDYEVVAVIENDFYIVTNDGADNNRLVKVNANAPLKTDWQTIIDERESVLESVSYINGLFILKYLEHASNKLYVYNTDGEYKGDIALPGLGSVGGPSGDRDEPVFFYSFSSYTYPSVIYKYDLDTRTQKQFFAPSLEFDGDEYVTEQVFYPSKDGTEIPMFITYKKGLELNGSAPVLLYGYGGFNISLTPYFRLTAIPFLEAGGIYAVANLRGGGEYGKEWHEAGTKERKQNVFDDFIAAAEYLIAENYASPERIAIQGGSNGGLLVGACMTQRPDLFKVALPAVGVLDMLRFHKFTIGWAWTGDYGSSDEAEGFDYLIKYSPLHNIEEGVEYPATLVTTADHDDRVVPAHSFKFISELQYKHTGENPVLIRIETMAGHGAGKPTSKQIDEATDVISFMMYNLGMSYDF
ncbi:MAG: S9 family peptidase [Bacteroidales bacterium]|nr:S9 family peptidase [Bacteroidales bacterium]